MASFSEIIAKSKFKGQVLRLNDVGANAHPNLKCYVRQNDKKFYFRRRSYEKVIGSVDDMTITEARHKASQMLAELLANGVPVLKQEGVYQKTLKRTFRDLADEIVHRWNVPSEVTKFKTSEYALKRFYDKPVGHITKLTVRAWMSSYGADKAPGTVKMHFDFLSGVLNKAVEDELLEYNPIKGMKKPTVIDQRTRHLGEKEDDEYQRFFDALNERDDHLVPYCYIAAYTGMRKMEILSMQWKFINWKAKTVTLPVHKTDHIVGDKVVDLHDQVVQVLKNWRGKCTSQTYLFPSPSTAGHITTIKRSWATLLRAANIENFRPHDMRHTFVSRLIHESKQSLMDVAAIVGHKDLRSTKRYSHMARQDKKRAVDALK